MYKYLIVPDLLGIIICCVVLYGTLFETKQKDKRRRYLIYAILFSMIQSGFDILGYINIRILKSYGLSICIFIVTGAGTLITIDYFMKYVRYVLESYDVDIAKKTKAFTIYSYVSVSIIAIIALLKLAFYIDDGKIVILPGFFIYLVLLISGYIFYFTVIISTAKKISKRVFVILIGYLALPIILNVVLTVLLPRYMFQFSIMDITLVLVYVILQSNIQDDSEQEKMEYFESMAAIYRCLNVIDFDKKSFVEYGQRKVNNEYKKKELDLQKIMWRDIVPRICEAHREAIKEFTDFSTLNERMKGSNMIYIELINVEKKWYQLSFIRIGKEEKHLKKVLFTSIDIDDSKRKERELILLSNTDQLTHLYNRNAYEAYLKEVEVNGIPDDLIYVGFDLNGLKAVNDTFGHDAGDELIIKMAEYLTESFADYGRVYRIGGDEFVVILQAAQEEYRKMISKLKKLQENYHNSFVSELSCSIGMASAKEDIGKSMVEIRKIADQRMYECKREYYKKNGKDRRE